MKEKMTLFSLSSLVCSVMVVGIHCYGVNASDSMSLTARVEGFFSHGLFTAAVPIFFAISGYLFFRDVDTLSDVYVKQKKRVRSLLVPFLAWSSFYYILYAFASRLATGITTTVDVSFVGIVKGIIFYEYVFPMWFMFQLVIYVILAPVLFEILKKPTVAIFFIIGMSILGVLGMKMEVNIGGLVRTLFMPNMFCYYFLGGMSAQYNRVFTTIGQRVVKYPTYSLIAGG